MGGRCDAAWVWCVLAVLIAGLTCCALASEQRIRGDSGGALLSSPPNNRTLLVLEIDMTDPVEQVGDFLACSFRAHRPSVANMALDVLITLSGRRPADDARELAVIEMVQDAVSESMAVPQPAFHTAFLPADRPGHDLGAVGGTKNVPDLISFLDDSPPGRTYDHAIILDAHACALRVGWLDVVLAPVLRNPRVLLSGPPPKDCHARSKTPACHDTNANVRPTAGSLTKKTKLLDLFGI